MKHFILSKYLKMNFFYCIFITLIGLTFFFNVSSSYSLTCCYHITVTTEIVDSCCVKIDVYNPYCNTSPETRPLIHFTQYNSKTRTYEVQESVHCPKESTVTYTLCPINNETEVNYRILIDDPECAGPYVEGYTMRTGTVDLSFCCDCPENRNDWLSVLVEKDHSCPNAGCKVTLDLDIPDSITCFRYYIVDDIYGVDTPVLSIENDPISEYSFCLNAGQSGYMNVVLLQHPDQYIMDGCILEKFVECDTTTSGDTVAMPCTPDCEDDE
ncbi:MAG: hypothetical protein EPN82_06950 [Bacteroidetes bacterium]|nr:MAG: hypothetical protein EPN82_06950 [Bacteroidota bacterium]